MSILIKDMKMPERCLECPFYDNYNYYCILYSFGIPARYNRDGSTRPEWCEIKELPERKKGEWEEIEVIQEAYDIAGVKTWASKMRCNQCGFTTFAIEGHFAQYDFCPSCGVRMDGESE